MFMQSKPSVNRRYQQQDPMIIATIIVSTIHDDKDNIPTEWQVLIRKAVTIATIKS